MHAHHVLFLVFCLYFLFCQITCILIGCCVHTRHYTLCMFEFSRNIRTILQTSRFNVANFKKCSLLTNTPCEAFRESRCRQNHPQNTSGITHHVVSKHWITCKLEAYMDSSDKNRITAQHYRCQWAWVPSCSRNRCLIFLPLILTVGELGPADCFLHPLQFWHRLSASEMKEHRESSSNLSESSKENLSPSSHSANISSMTSICNPPPMSTDSNFKSLLRYSSKNKTQENTRKKNVQHWMLGEGRPLATKTQLGEATARP